MGYYDETTAENRTVERLLRFMRAVENPSWMVELVEEMIKELKWIPVTDRFPENDDYILLSFENYSIPLVGRYESDGNSGGKFYVGDDMESCISADLFVNAWMPLPKPYRPEI